MKNLFRAVAVAAAMTGALLLAAGPAAAALNAQDRTWLVAAHQSNLAEIAAGTSAQSRATTSDVKNLGAMFVRMHTELDNALKPVAQQLGVALPSTPTADQQAQLARVEANSGQAYDTAWIAQQIASHQATLAATQRELAGGSDPAVLQLARNATPVVQQHLTELRAAAAKYGVPTSVPGGTGGQAAQDDRTTSLALVGAGGLLVLASGVMLARRRRA